MTQNQGKKIKELNKGFKVNPLLTTRWLKMLEISSVLFFIGLKMAVVFLNYTFHVTSLLSIPFPLKFKQFHVNQNMVKKPEQVS